ncbi:RagB/SusD family nutrient uptake outer membrane protein [Spirosoma utsteinense]|uniref:Tetratricopeptide (TPR) repeat protein n=1 Tax=Spirosoma utsteinense TaxID=2585773 RepID=A0ABR6W082_9BACT|nr:RagB/SusD family nutrient uptake outer membrane protein [Spirosoma utsteinense]MBC3786572.1 tetratricopeptide (TPR) repeat protein [Spirosoma utsteinense]MBC3789950.1 tetratricopeptide (TPR) repeat protein [Spirosoma utsteinense]
MKKTIIRGASLIVLLTTGSIACKDSFLDVAPTGQLVSSLLTSKDGLEGLLISAYAQLNGRGYSQTASSTNWLYGSIMGGDANKGSDPSDFNGITPFETYQITAANSELNARWNALYEGVSRANSVLRTVPNAVATVTDAVKLRLTGEARFLRGLYYFDLKRTFNMVPYIDETVDYGAGITEVQNNVDIWPQIEADFKFAYDNLPAAQTQAGQANKWAAASYLAKVYMHEKKYAEAKALFDLIIASGTTSNGKKYGLVPQYAQIFNAANENNEETIFSTQNVANAGSSDAASNDLNLNYPYSGVIGPGCCDFFKPSFDLANSFRTDATGLPIDVAQTNGAYDSPTNELKSDLGLLPSDAFTPDTRTVDPRLDHTVGRRGIPYLDWGPFTSAWTRNQLFGGPYSTKKYVYYLAQQSQVGDVSNWTKGWSATNVVLMRYADVLLLAAEAEVEVGSVETARRYVNLVRARAANPAGFVKTAAGAPAANYVVSQYPATTFASKDAARAAVRFERKLELAEEGHRFFDLVRWGIAAPALNAFLTYEKTKLPNAYSGAAFVAGKNEYLPLPQTQIDLQSTSILKQNPGY